LLTSVCFIVGWIVARQKTHPALGGGTVCVHSSRIQCEKFVQDLARKAISVFGGKVRGTSHTSQSPIEVRVPSATGYVASSASNESLMARSACRLSMLLAGQASVTILVLCKNKSVFGEQLPGAVSLIDKRRNMERPYLLKLGQSEPFGKWLGLKCFDMQRNERFTRALQLFTQRGKERLGQHAGTAGAPAAAGAGATAASEETVVDVEMYASPPASPFKDVAMAQAATPSELPLAELVSPAAKKVRGTSA
jgi:hypothetical protein